MNRSVGQLVREQQIVLRRCQQLIASDADLAVPPLRRARSVTEDDSHEAFGRRCFENGVGVAVHHDDPAPLFLSLIGRELEVRTPFAKLANEILTAGIDADRMGLHDGETPNSTMSSATSCASLRFLRRTH